MPASHSFHGAPTVLSGEAPRRPAPEPVGLAETARPADAIETGATVGSDQAGAGPRPELPARIGRYLVARELGSGGMGVVALAFDPELDRRVAVKLLRTRDGAPGSHARLLREAQAMARLSHPNVVQVYDVGAIESQVYVAMELVDGQTLAAWQEAARRGWRDVVEMYLAAGRGLAAAHAAGLVHRDFKPDNVLLGKDGRVCVADFGLAREDARALAEAEDNPGEAGLLAASLTRTGAIMGTPFYMSPEQHRGAPAGPASDQFSFCVALFEALHGSRPFRGQSMGELAAAVLSGAVQPPRRDDGVPAKIDAALRRGLATRPEERHPDMNALLAALERSLRRTGRAWAGGTAVALSAATLGWSLAPAAAAETCSGGQALIDEVWGAPARAALAERLGGGDDASRVLAGLDAYAATWAAAHVDACEDHRRGEHSSALLDLRARCLDLRRHALASAAEVLTAGDAAALREASTVVARLPAISSCDDLAALTAEVAPPEDPKLAGEVEAQRRRLVAAGVLADAGKVDDGLAEVAAVRGRALELGYRPLVAEAALAAGRLALAAFRAPVARASLTEAFVAATATRQDAIAAEAKARQIFVLAGFEARADDAIAERPLAEALVERTGGRAELAALLANNLGVAYAERGERATAAELFRSAADGAGPATGPLDRASYLQNAAMLSADPDARARLFARAGELLGGALGPAHLSTLQLRSVEARHTDDPARAIPLLAATCPALQSRYPAQWEACSECYIALGELQFEATRAAEAVTSFTAARACLEVEASEGDRQAMTTLRTHVEARIDGLSGRPDAALGALATARAAYEPHAAHWWIARWLADGRLAEGEALLALGRTDAAIAALEPALASHVAEAARAEWSRARRGAARARVALAEALGRRGGPGDRERADELLAAAEAYYRGIGDAARLDAVAAVRAATPSTGS